jgi:hypothetical protein
MPSPIEVFNLAVNTARTETIAQKVELFNAASNNALMLTAGNNQGDFNTEAYYAEIAGLVRRRNQYGTGTVAAIDLAQLVANSVKIAAGTPPVNVDPRWWSWMNKNPAEAGTVLGIQLAEASLQDMLEVATLSLNAAFDNVGATVVNTTGAVASLVGLDATAGLFGDRQSNISAWVMHSGVFNQLSQAGLTNTERLFTYANVNIMQDATGRPFIVSDIANLKGATYSTLGLVPGAAKVEQNGDYLMNVETRNGDENIRRTQQSEWTYNLSLKGYKWDETNGGASPSDAALGTGTNWDKQATDIKNTAGVKMVSLLVAP